MRKILHYIFYNKKTGKLDLGITVLISFFVSAILFTSFIFLVMFLVRDNTYRVERLHQQIRNAKNVQEYFPYPFFFKESVDIIKNDTIVREMRILGTLKKSALIYYSYRGIEYDWKVDTVIVVKVVPNKDLNKLRGYKLKK